MQTRTRIIILSLLVPLVFVVLSLVDFNGVPFITQYKSILIPGVIALIEMLGVAWSLHYHLKGERYLTVLFFPAVSLAILISFIDLLSRSAGDSVNRVSTILFSGSLLFVLTYILTASINILNLASIKNIPLGQAAKAAHYILTMIFSYISFVLLVGVDLFPVFKAILVFFLIFLFTYVALWTISLKVDQRFLSSLAIAFICMFGYLVFSLWPLESFYFALFMTLIYYMALGVALEIREIVNRFLWYEYTAIFLTIILILLFTANWGINGTIF
jgi:hypothetical protein